MIITGLAVYGGHVRNILDISQKSVTVTYRGYHALGSENKLRSFKQLAPPP